MLKNDITKYLQYGTTWDFKYGESVETIDISWEDAKHELHRLIKNALVELNPESICFTGTLGGYALTKIYDREMISWSVDIGVELDDMCSSLKLDNRIAIIKNVEDILIDLNRMWPSPQCELEDIYAYTRQTDIGKHHGGTTTLCEGGSDWVLMGENRRWYSTMNRGVINKEYDPQKAYTYEQTYKTIKLNSYKMGKNYFNCFTKDSNIFTDDDIDSFGLPHVDIKLRNESLTDLTRMAYDWGLMRFKTKTEPLTRKFGFAAHPIFLLNKELVNFCLSLPMEMKYCLGDSRHILKKIIKIDDQLAHGIYAGIQSKVMSSMDGLISKYILNKKMKIYNILPYDEVLKHKDSFLKIWHLINLSIWVEVHNDKPKSL